MPRLLCLAVIVLVAACGAKQQTLTVVNRTPRGIAELYVYPVGSAQHGASRGTLAPNATLVMKLPVGHHEVLAVSDKIQVDEKTRETRTASQAVELKQTPIELVFFDSAQPPPGLERPGTIGAAFRVPPPVQ